MYTREDFKTEDDYDAYQFFGSLEGLKNQPDTEEHTGNIIETEARIIEPSKVVFADNSNIIPVGSVARILFDEPEEQLDLSVIGVCTGHGAYHTDNVDSKNPKSYDLITFSGIKALIDKPVKVAKDQGQWIIPSYFKSRKHIEQFTNGLYLYLWADIDFKDTLPDDCKTIQEIGGIVSSIIPGFDFEVWATRGSTIDKQKCRILIPLNEMIGARDWLNSQDVLFELLKAKGIEDDEATLRAGQVCYLPNKGKFYDSFSVRTGNYLDVKGVWEDALQAKEAALQAEEKEIKAKILESKIQREKAYIEVNGDVLQKAEDLFNEQYRIADLLLQSGQYTQMGGRWNHHNASTFSGYILDNTGVEIYYSHSGSGDVLNETNTKAPNGHTAFNVFKWLNHNGDYKAAIKDATENYLMINGRPYAEVDRELYLKKQREERENNRKNKGLEVSDNTYNGVVHPDDFKLDVDRDGYFLKDYTNVSRALKTPSFCGVEFALDKFNNDTVFRNVGGKWESLREEHLLSLPHILSKLGFKEVPLSTAKDAAKLACLTNKIDTGIEWLESLEWDGVPRIEHFLTNYFGCEDREYTRAVSMYIWTALADRMLNPGCKADMMPIFKSIQGTQKTSGIEAMAPSLETFGVISFSHDDAENIRKLQGKNVIEIAELRGFNTKEATHIKDFVTTRNDELRKLYQDKPDKLPRRCIFFGTTNEDEFLADPTGERRYLPLVVGKQDVDAIKRDKEQLWAEGAVYFKEHGQQWGEAERLAKLEHSKFKMIDIWQEKIEEFLQGNFPDGDYRSGFKRELWYKTDEILIQALGITLERADRKVSVRISSIMKNLGYEMDGYRREGTKTKAWIKKKKP